MIRLALALVLSLGCAADPTLPTRCTPNATVACVCPGGGTSTQVCSSDGSGYSLCLCDVRDASADVIDASSPADAPAVEDRPAALDAIAAPDVVAGPDVVDAGALRPDVVDAGVPADVVRRDGGADFLPDGGCPANYGDCDGNRSNGCEVDLRAGERETHGGGLGYSYHNCGRCDRYCNSSAASRVACVEGMCSITCDRGYYDCDSDPSNGCESTLSDSANCGACGTRCSAGQRCSGAPHRCIP